MGASGLIETDFRPIEPAPHARKIIAAIDAAYSNRPGIHFQPGYAGADPLIFTTWPSVVAAVAAAPCPVTIYFDPAGLGAATYTIPAGIYDLKGSTLERYKLAGDIGPLGTVTLNIPAGSQLRNLSEGVGDMVLNGNATALVPSLAWDVNGAPDPAPEYDLVLRDNFVCTNDGASPMVSVADATGIMRLRVVRTRGWVSNGFGPFINMVVGGAGARLAVEAHKWQMPDSSGADFLTTAADSFVGFVDDGSVPSPVSTVFTGINALATVTHILWNPGGASTVAQRPTPGRVGLYTFDTTFGRPIFWNGTAWVGAEAAAVIFRPGVLTADPQAVSTWPQVMAVVAASAVPITIYFDPTGLGAPGYVLPAGTYDMKNATLERYRLGGALGPLGAVSISIPAGSQLRNLSEGVGDMVLVGNATALVPSLAWDAPAAPEPAPEVDLVLRDNFVCTNAGASPMIVVDPAVAILRLRIVRSRGWVTDAAGVFISMLAGGAQLAIEAHKWQIPAASVADFVSTAIDSVLGFIDDGSVPGPIRTVFTGINALATVTHTLWNPGGASSAVTPNARPTAGRDGVQTIDEQTHRGLAWRSASSLWMSTADTVLAVARDFHVDPTNPAASDNNDGSIAAPLATVAGLQQLIGFNPKIAAAINVYLHGDPVTHVFAENISFSVDVHPGGIFRVRGVTTQFDTGTITAVPTVRSNAAGTYLTITGAPAGHTWAQCVGKQIRLTSGANIGAKAWVVAETVPGTALVTGFNTYDPATSAAVTGHEITPGNVNYEILDVPVLTGELYISTTGNYGFVADSNALTLEDVDVAIANAGPVAVAMGSFVNIVGVKSSCAFGYNLFGVTNINVVNGYGSAGGGFIAVGGSVSFIGGGHSVVFSAGSPALIFLRDGFTVFGNGFTVTSGAKVQIYDAMAREWAAGMFLVKGGSTVELVNANALGGTSTVVGAFLFDVLCGTVMRRQATWAGACPARGPDPTLGQQSKLAGNLTGFTLIPATGVPTAVYDYTIAKLDTPINVGGAGDGFGGNALSYFGSAAMSRNV